ncbi:MAG: DUF2948 family protein [Alphaproteobacteria bacterium]|nr:DUF2948 family protein [Alphaproteobacteria bacterium]
MSPLRLRAIDQLDLSVIAAHLQDAVAKVGDMGFDPKRRRFAILVNRFMWEDVQDDLGAGPKADRDAPYRRVRSAVHFEGVLRVQSSALRLAEKEAVAELLTLKFEPRDEPGGIMSLTFAGGAALRLEVECLDAWLSDISAPWSTERRPDHETGDGGAGS